MPHHIPLRKHLGLPVTVFADIIGCSAGHLSMVECGKRALPLAAVALLHKIESVQLQQPATTATVIQPERVALLDKHIRVKRLMADKVRQRATQLTGKQEQAKRVIQLAAAMETNSFAAEEEDASLRLALLKRQAQKRLTVLWQQWVKVELTIASLDAEINRAQELKYF